MSAGTIYVACKKCGKSTGVSAEIASVVDRIVGLSPQYCSQECRNWDLPIGVLF